MAGRVAWPLMLVSSILSASAWSVLLCEWAGVRRRSMALNATPAGACWYRGLRAFAANWRLQPVPAHRLVGRLEVVERLQRPTTARRPLIRTQHRLVRLDAQSLQKKNWHLRRRGEGDWRVRAGC